MNCILVLFPCSGRKRSRDRDGEDDDKRDGQPVATHFATDNAQWRAFGGQSSGMAASINARTDMTRDVHMHTPAAGERRDARDGEDDDKRDGQPVATHFATDNTQWRAFGGQSSGMAASIDARTDMIRDVHIYTPAAGERRDARGGEDDDKRDGQTVATTHFATGERKASPLCLHLWILTLTMRSGAH